MTRSASAMASAMAASILGLGTARHNQKSIGALLVASGERADLPPRRNSLSVPHFTGHRSSIRLKISSSHLIESAMALTVAGTRFPSVALQ
jgi:hypothetical protein